MPRKYISQHKRGKWTAEDLQKALDDIKNGKGQRETSRTYEIPLSTLRDRIKSQKRDDPSLGCRTILSPEDEITFKNRLVVFG